MKSQNEGASPKAGQADKKNPGVAVSKDAQTPDRVNPLNQEGRFYRVDRDNFLPIKPEATWDDEQDLREYEARFGESEDPLQDTRSLLAWKWDELHDLLASGIHYFLRKQGARRLAPVAELSLRGKVELFTDLLPDSLNTNYVLRFTTNLARILWLESEQARILAQRDNRRWLYPLYELADCVAATQFELMEALRCEHDDFDEGCVSDGEADDDVPQPRHGARVANSD